MPLTENLEKRRIIHHEAQADIDRFEEIMDEISELTEEAMNLIPDDGDCNIRGRAKAYWYAQIQGIVNGRASVHTMEDTKKELEEWHAMEI